MVTLGPLGEIRESGGGRDTRSSSEPLGRPGIAIVHGVENEFHAAGDPKFFEDPKKIFLDGVLAEIEFTGDVAVAQALRHQGDDLFLAGSEQRVSSGIQHAQGRDFGDQIQKVVELFCVDPNLSSGNPKDAFVKLAQVGMCDGEDPAGSAAHGACDEFPIVGVDEHDLRYAGMGKMELPQCYQGF
jgi:hypothetical protein